MVSMMPEQTNARKELIFGIRNNEHMIMIPGKGRAGGEGAFVVWATVGCPFGRLVESCSMKKLKLLSHTPTKNINLGNHHYLKRAKKYFSSRFDF